MSIHSSGLGKEFIYGRCKEFWLRARTRFLSVLDANQNTFISVGGCWKFVRRFDTAVKSCSRLCVAKNTQTLISGSGHRVGSRDFQHHSNQWFSFSACSCCFSDLEISDAACHSKNYQCSHRWKEAKSQQPNKPVTSKQVLFVVGNVEDVLQVLPASWIALRIKWLRWVVLASRVLEDRNFGGTPYVCTYSSTPECMTDTF